MPEEDEVLPESNSKKHNWAAVQISFIQRQSKATLNDLVPCFLQ